MKKKSIAVLLLVMMLVCSFTACGSSAGSVSDDSPLSVSDDAGTQDGNQTARSSKARKKKSPTMEQYVVGTWSGQVDVAKIMYQGLSKELGVELSPDPEYCDMTMTFNADKTCAMEVDTTGFAKAAGKCAEPYTSAIFGFDTGSLVDLIMQYVASDIPVDTGRETGTYTVDNKNLTVTITNGDGGSDTMYLTKDGLQYQDHEINQVISFQKQ